MPRYMIYLKNSKYLPKDASTLLGKARGLFSDTQITIRDTRVSRDHIEFDTNAEGNSVVDDITNKLSLISPLSEYEQIVEKHMSKEEAFKTARSLFNQEKYWATHEVLESVWKNLKGDERDLVNGIILIAAAFVHAQKDESEICISILKRAIRKLSKSDDFRVYYGIDICKLKHLVTKIIETHRLERILI
jgi:uncharacterized protein